MTIHVNGDITYVSMFLSRNLWLMFIHVKRKNIDGCSLGRPPEDAATSSIVLDHILHNKRKIKSKEETWE